jgi:hypothetical protein
MFFPGIALFMVFGTKNKFIENGNVPKCKDCIYLDKNNLVVDNDIYYLSTCKKFGKANLVSGEIKHDYADFCRKDELKCGVEGKYFVSKFKDTPTSKPVQPTDESQKKQL